MINTRTHQTERIPGNIRPPLASSNIATGRVPDKRRDIVW